MRKIKNPFEFYSSAKTKSKSRNLDWEEAALDEESEVEGFADEHRTPPSLRWLAVLVTAAIIILAAKLFSLQVVNGSKYRIMSEGNRLRNQVIIAPRGHIIDRTGQILARNTASFSLIATPADLPKGDRAAQTERLALLFGLDKNSAIKQVIDAGTSSIQPVVLKSNLSQEESILFETHASEFVGFSVASVPIREYPDPEVFSHVLGYTGVVSEKELEKQDSQYDPNDYIGKLGIELTYEKYLKGFNGVKQTEVDATGKPIKVLGNIEPVPGGIVHLNINAGLQKQLYQSFKKFSPNAKGAAIALDPTNGQVLALVSVPGFDNNLFAPGISTSQYKTFLEDKNLPLYNRAVSGTYPPGSTLKVVAAAAALQEQIVSPETVIVDRGVLVIPNQYDPSQQYNFYGWKRSGLGPMTVRSAIAESSDIYFYTVAGGHPNSPIKGLGAEKLADYYRKFHLGQATGIDLQGEKPGVVADPDWKARYFKNDPVLSRWYLGDTYHIGIGQGDILVTPLQVAVWTAAIANNGIAYKPILVNEVTDQQGNVIYKPKTEAIVTDVASLSNLKVVQEGMRETVLRGSGVQLSTLPIPTAGKTGTSQFDGSDPSRTHAWFTAYGPYDNPRLVITILVEAGGEGHAAAVPIAKDAFKWCIENNCMPK